jgi:putative DNA primase/helicase
MIANLAVFEGGDRLIHALSKPYPKYSHKETQDKINHFLESGTKPITCRTIAEKGFRCPRLEDNSCGCKSPAALCYKPLSVEELREFLSGQPVAKSAVDNVQKAQDFVRDFLYNADPVVAGTFIEYEMKEHFGLKAGAVKSLSALQKDLFKEYRESKETKRETMGEELPDWYEPSERGGLRFIPGLLASHMAKNVSAFYGAESYYIYENGVYKAASDLQAAARVRGHLIERYATMSAINDTPRASGGCSFTSPSGKSTATRLSSTSKTGCTTCWTGASRRIRRSTILRCSLKPRTMKAQSARNSWPSFRAFWETRKSI